MNIPNTNYVLQMEEKIMPLVYIIKAGEKKERFQIKVNQMEDRPIKRSTMNLS